jgi:2-polyprenyl-6-methoxyphenol hydroxylase-like FAD-dependent oxidoreductase
MGLTDEINRAGYHIREMRILNANGKRISGFGTKVFGELTGGRYITIGRSDLSRLLFETIKSHTEIVFGDEIIGLQEQPDSVQVTFKRGSQRRFDLVIGADGLHSTVRGLVFGPQERFERPLGYIVAAFEGRGYRPRDNDVYVTYCQPGRMLGRVALSGDRTLFLLSLRLASTSDRNCSTKQHKKQCYAMSLTTESGKRQKFSSNWSVAGRFISTASLRSKCQLGRAVGSR